QRMRIFPSHGTPTSRLDQALLKPAEAAAKILREGGDRVCRGVCKGFSRVGGQKTIVRLAPHCRSCARWILPGVTTDRMMAPRSECGPVTPQGPCHYPRRERDACAWPAPDCASRSRRKHRYAG